MGSVVKVLIAHAKVDIKKCTIDRLKQTTLHFLSHSGLLLVKDKQLIRVGRVTRPNMEKGASDPTIAMECC